MLLDAGYGVKEADGTIAVQDKDGKPVKLTLATTPGSSISENLAFLVKQELADIGIEVDIKAGALGDPSPAVCHEQGPRHEPGAGI